MEKKNTGGIIGRGYTTHPSSATPTPRQAAPLTKETCSLPAAARAHASRRRDASRRSAYDSRLGLSLSFSFRLDGAACFHDRDARVACILRAEDFAVSRGKDNPPVCTPTSSPLASRRAVTSSCSATGNYRNGGLTSCKLSSDAMIPVATWLS